jgi:hypothetical protein
MIDARARIVTRIRDVKPLTVGTMPDATAGLLSMAHSLRISQARLDLRVSAEDVNWGRSDDRCR